MKKLLVGLVVALAVVVMSGCTLPGFSSSAKPTIPSATCANLVAAASMENGPIKGVAACLDATGKSNLGITVDDDWPQFRATFHGAYGTVAFYPNQPCGEYSGSTLAKKYSASWLKDYAFAYSVTIDPNTYPVVYQHSILVIIEDQKGLVEALGFALDSTTMCP